MEGHLQTSMDVWVDHNNMKAYGGFGLWLEPENVCHSITTRETPKRWMKERLFTKHCNTIEPMMLADDRKAIIYLVCPLFYTKHILQNHILTQNRDIQIRFRTCDPKLFNYSLIAQILKEVMDPKYLEVTLSNNLEWSNIYQP